VLGCIVAFTRPLQVFDPSNLSKLKEASAPQNSEEWALWFQSHPYLDTSKPVSVSVGGASGVRIDVMETSTPENYPQDICGEQPCVPLFPPGPTMLIPEGVKNRFVIADVEDKTVVINVVAPADESEEFLLKAQALLDTVQWENSGPS
jgi:hypothetical protein